MRSLRGRLTLSYAAFVAVILIGFAVILTRVAFALLAQPTTDAVAQAVAAANAIVAAHPHEGRGVLGPQIKREVSGPGVIVLLPPSDVPQGPGPGGHDDQIGFVRAFSLTTLLGLREHRVALPDMGAVLIAPDLRRLSPAVHIYLASLAVSVVLAIALAWVVARWLAFQAIAPLTTVTRELRRFAGGDLTPRALTTRDRGELGELIAAYNGAAAQVSSALDERLRVEEQMRRFVADAGHELRTPLTAISGFVDVLQRGGIADQAIRERAFRTLRAETRRMRRLVERLMALARLDRPEVVAPETVDVAEIASDAVAEVVAARRGDVRLQCADAAGLLVTADPGDVHEAIGNLVDNAVKYGAGSVVTVDVARDGEDVLVRVHDRGPGIPTAERAHVFERFFRGDATGGVEGSGLGLAIVHRAVERSGGSVTFDCDAGGTTFELRFPARQAAAVYATLRV